MYHIIYLSNSIIIRLNHIKSRQWSKILFLISKFERWQPFVRYLFTSFSCGRDSPRALESSFSVSCVSPSLALCSWWSYFGWLADEPYFVCRGMEWVLVSNIDIMYDISKIQVLYYLLAATQIFRIAIVFQTSRVLRTAHSITLY